jgi:peptidyl-prolyl cis-trans isomerase NIMA-interacting 1
MQRTLLWALGVSLTTLACGGAPPPPPDKKPEAAVVGDPKEAACLEQAALPREAKKDAPEKITISHVLVRHADLKRSEDATRTRGQACLRAEEAREKLLAGAEWADIVKSHSDAGEATGGSLGTVGKDELEPTFADAAFALGVGELSHVVETSRGFHVIVRTE